MTMTISYPQLPPDLRSKINSHLELEDFCTLARVSHAWRRVILVNEFNNDATWTIIRDRLGYVYPPVGTPLSLRVIRHVFTIFHSIYCNPGRNYPLDKRPPNNQTLPAFIRKTLTRYAYDEHKNDIRKIDNTTLSHPGRLLADVNLLLRWSKARDTYLIRGYLLWKQLNSQKGTAERMWVIPDKGGASYIIAMPFVELSGLLRTEEFTAKAKEFADASANLKNKGINQTELRPDSSVLNLQDLLLMSLPNAIDWSAFSHITKVQLDNNRLSTLPESLSHLSNLQSLFLQQNLFFKLPTVISRFSKLTHLDISQNPLVFEPEALTQMPSLVWLGISIDQTVTRTTFDPPLTERVIKELQSKNPNFTYKIDQKQTEPFCIHDDTVKKSFCNFTFFGGKDPTRILKYLCTNGTY